VLALPPAPVEQAHPIRDWSARQAARFVGLRARTEQRAFGDEPRVTVRWPWAGHGGPVTSRQTLRAFIQINVLPRPR